jgi:hypothetical protein
MRYIAFDIEISKPLPDKCEDWKQYRPLGISCAATLRKDTEKPEWNERLLWCGGNVAWSDAPDRCDSQYGEDAVNWMLAAQMSQFECSQLLDYLRYGEFMVVTWNGLAFDFDILAEEAYAFDKPLAIKLAMSHTDMAFHMLCELGYMCSLQNASKGMKLEGKKEGISGAKAPDMWKESREQQNLVLEYVKQDVKATAELYEAVLHTGSLGYLTRKGAKRRMLVPHWRTVEEAMRQPELPNPLRGRKECYEWTM